MTKFVFILFFLSPRHLERNCWESCHGSCPSLWLSPPLGESTALSLRHHGQLKRHVLHLVAICRFSTLGVRFTGMLGYKKDVFITLTFNIETHVTSHFNPKLKNI